MFFTGRSHRDSGWRPGASFLLAVVLGAAVLGPGASARQGTAAEVGVALKALPVEAQTTHRLIREGGPFKYQKDGIVFGNRERLLPRQPRGYYREYTVPTPKSRDRGARRIVCGGLRSVSPDACYYTDDHYASFRLIAP
ncbi:ribonuclease domain-containing protein [Methylibium sp.]|uniref:ribonuclease domain-containing protein n=1 Tax=Methylibium sp. TaxID=2067992 RepID=UPI00286C8B4D|nr:ribonuclease domain-containing protein [Methylibium sp.]